MSKEVDGIDRLIHVLCGRRATERDRESSELEVTASLAAEEIATLRKELAELKREASVVAELVCSKDARDRLAGIHKTLFERDQLRDSEVRWLVRVIDGIRHATGCGWVRTGSGEWNNGVLGSNKLGRRTVDGKLKCQNCCESDECDALLARTSGDVRMISEEWKPLPFGSAMYEVSDHGRVRSLVRRKFGRQLIRKLVADRDGYLRVSLFSRNDPHRGCYGVARLVLRTFRGEPPNLTMLVRHLNGIRDDNRLENLVWGTHDENMRDRDRHGTTARGSRNEMWGKTRAHSGEVNGSRKIGSHEGAHHDPPTGSGRVAQRGQKVADE